MHSHAVATCESPARQCRVAEVERYESRVGMARRVRHSFDGYLAFRI